MQRKPFYLLVVCVCLLQLVKAAPDSTKTNSSDYQYNAPTTIFGKFDPLSLSNSGQKTMVGFYSDFYTASNCFTVSFIQNFFGSGFITEQMKDDASANLSDLNRIGIDFYNGAYFMTQMKNNDHNYFIAEVNYNFEESAQFAKDLFHFVFYGNYDLQDYTADFSDSKFSLTSFAEYKIGMMKVYDKNYNQFKFGVTGGFVQGLSGVDVEAKNTTMYTAVDGRYIDLTYDLNINTSGENAPSLTAIVGAGFSVDAFAQIDLQGPGIALNAMVSDIGTVFWNKDPLKISGDSTIHFEGIQIDNFFSGTETAATGTNDSLLEILGVQQETNAFSQALPTRINVSATKRFANNTMYFTLGGQYILNVPYTPLIFIQTGKTIPAIQTTLSVNAHIGGYGDYNVGLDLTKDFGNAFQLKLGSNSLLGVISPDAFTGAAGYASLAVKF